MSRGRYIVLEGTDGAGKTEQVKRVIAALERRGKRAVSVYEPGGNTLMGDEIRRILKANSIPRQALTNVMLFNAARVEALTTIKRHVDAGEWVVCDRNRLSTFVYQSFAEGIDRTLIKLVDEELHEYVGILPDLELVLIVPWDVAKDRMAKRNEEADYFESSLELQRLILGYEYEAHRRDLPKIEASGTIEEVFELVWQHIEPLLEEAK